MIKNKFRSLITKLPLNYFFIHISQRPRWTCKKKKSYLVFYERKSKKKVNLLFCNEINSPPSNVASVSDGPRNCPKMKFSLLEDAVPKDIGCIAVF